MHVRRGSPIMLAATSLVAVLLTTGCGAEASSPSLATEAATQTNQSATASAASDPPPKTPKAFVRLWVKEANSIQADGRVGTFLAMSPGCDACAQFAKRVRKMYRKGGYIHTDGWTVRSITLVQRLPNHASFELKYLSAPTEYQEAAGTAVKHYDGGPGSVQVFLTRRGGNWGLIDYSRL